MYAQSCSETKDKIVKNKNYRLHNFQSIIKRKKKLTSWHIITKYQKKKKNKTKRSTLRLANI